MRAEKTFSDPTAQLLSRRITGGSTLSQMKQLLSFLLFDAGLMRDPLLIYAILSSISRAALIFSINETAATLAQGMWPIVFLLISAACSLFFGHLSRVRGHSVVKQVQHDMRRAMSRRLLAADIDFMLRHDKGHVYTVMTQEIQAVSSSSINLIEAAEALLLLMICIPYLFWISWFSGLAALVAVAIGTSGFVFAELPARRLVERANSSTARFVDRVSDMLAGWMELRLRKSRRVDLARDIDDAIGDVRDLSIEAERRFSTSQAFGQAALIGLICMVVLLLPRFQGADTTEMFQVMTVVLLAYGPIELVFKALPRLSRSVAAYKKIGDVVFDLQSRQVEPSEDSDTLSTHGFSTIELRNVTAHVGEGGAAGAGQEDAFVLGPVNLILKPGENVFFTGGNGSGKSTLMSLICGLRSPDSGEILMDGVAVGPDNIADFRGLFSAVLGEFHLFRNPYGLGKTEQETLAEMIETLGLKHRVDLVDGAFSTLALSTGQRRRLALAVATAENRPVIILDEYAADQDPESRAFFYDVLLKKMRDTGQLVLVVTHDEQEYHKSDRLIKMDQGRIVSDQKNPPAKTG